MDSLLAHLLGVPASAMQEWINPGRYVSGRELAAAGMAELVEFDQLHLLQFQPEAAELPPRASNGAAAGTQAHRKVVAPAARRRRRR
jgi:ATP-dependent Clp protease, protease subunit